MLTRSVVLMALAMTLPACAGVYGPKGNDTGGIIPWSPAAEMEARGIAGSMCATFNKAARITSMRRAYGEYIVYQCYFGGPLRRFGPG